MTEAHPLDDHLIDFAQAAYEACGTAEGVFCVISAVAAMVAAVLADVPEERMDAALSRVAWIPAGEIDPDPSLTIATVEYFRREARCGRGAVAEIKSTGADHAAQSAL